MKALNFLFIFSLFWVSSANKHKELAVKKANRGDSEQAITHLLKVVELQKKPEQEVLLNLAHLYYLTGNSDSARFYYKMVSSGERLHLASTAENQLGVIYFSGQKRDSAIYHFERALRLNPKNHQAAFNFELLKRTEQKRRHKPSGKPKSSNDPDNKNNTPLPSPSSETGTEEGIILKSVNNNLPAEELEKMLQAFKNRNNKYLQQEEWKKLNSEK